LQGALEAQQDRQRGQLQLFDGDGANGETVAAVLPNVPDWPDNEKLKYEKEALDFYFSSHPLAQHDQDLRSFSTHNTSQLAELGPNQEVVIGGMLTQVRFQNVKKARNGNFRYVRCKVEDLHGNVECVMWPDDFVRFKDQFDEDRICFVKGAVERTREEPGLVLTHLMTIEQAKRELTRGLVVSLNAGEHSLGILDAVGEVLRRTPGACPVFVSIRDAGGKRTVLRADGQYNINPAAVMVSELESLLGTGRVAFTGAGNGRNGN